MRITQIVPSLESRHGGPSISVPNLAQALASLGHDVALLTTRSPQRAPEPALYEPTEEFPRSRPEVICPSNELRRRVFSAQADVLHHHGLWLRPLHYAHQRARATGAPLVISPRGMMTPWAWEHHRWKKILASRFIHPGALDAVQGWHATSKEEVDDIRRVGFMQPICVAPNGVHAPSTTETDHAIVYWRAKCPEAFQRPTAVFYSRLHQKKRVIELIELWLARAPQEWLLLVVGIPQSYSIEELTKVVRDANGANRVAVFDGSSAPAPYVAGSLYLLPSHSENFGLTIAEALAHGLPALVTDTTPWSELNSTGNGWCVPWAQFGDALVRALDEGVLSLRRRGVFSRLWVINRYSWDTTARVIEEFYRTLAPTH